MAPLKVPVESPRSVEPGEAKAQPFEGASIAVRILTHNIRYATEHPFKGEAHWPIRCPRLCSQLVFSSMGHPEMFICLQEVLHLQLMDIMTKLNDAATFDKQWAYLGVGRDDGKQAGEYSPIFYRPSIWRVVRWETVWLSETPQVPSKGWDAGCVRIVTTGEFEHHQTRQKVIVMSTHLDDRGAQARRESAKMFLKLVSHYSQRSEPCAILLAGDFNSPPGDAAYQIMTSPVSSMVDAAGSVAPEKRYGNEMTFTSFGEVDAQPTRIDFVFSRKGDKLNFNTYGVLANRFDDGVYLSDHRACVVDFQLL